MAQNLVVNGVTYNGVESVAMKNGNGETVPFYPDAVRYNAQTLTDAQKEQARTNIGAASAAEVGALSDKIEACVPKNQGAANVGKILAVGTDGNLVLVDMPEGGVSGDVVGALDDSNNILLTGDLADGTYTLKYVVVDAEGNESYTDIGTLEVGAIPEPEPEKTNFFVVGGDGYLNPGRLSSAGADRTDTTFTLVTNYIAVQAGDIVAVSGCTIIPLIGTGTKPYMTGYSSAKSNVHTDNTYESNDYWTVDTLTSTTSQLTVLNGSIAYFRFVCGASSNHNILASSKVVDPSTIVINIKRNGEWL